MRPRGGVRSDVLCLCFSQLELNEQGLRSGVFSIGQEGKAMAV